MLKDTPSSRHILRSVTSPSISSNEITLDLSTAQTFTITASEDINAIVTNPPSGSSSFTLKILQDSTGGRSVGIDTFKNNSGTSIPVYWLVELFLLSQQQQIRQTFIRSRYLTVINLTTSGLYGVVVVGGTSVKLLENIFPDLNTTLDLNGPELSFTTQPVGVARLLV